MEINAEERLLNSRELAQFLNLRQESVIRLARNGGIPAIRIGGRWRFPKTEIEKWLQEKQCKQSNVQSARETP